LKPRRALRNERIEQMEMWTSILIVAHVLIAMAIIGLVLLQHGKGADMGSGFGGGASGSLFGATGSANFLSRATAVLATVFFLTSKPRTTGGVLDVSKTLQSAPAKAPEKAAADKPAAESSNTVPKTPAEPAKSKDVPQ
jgi:preprotein translocase subunit SecG